MAVPFAVMYPGTVLTDGDALEPTVAHAGPRLDLSVETKEYFIPRAPAPPPGCRARTRYNTL